MATLGIIVIFVTCVGVAMRLGYIFGYEDGQIDLEAESHHYDLNT